MVIITGASRGIGEYLLEAFLQDGEEVLGTYNTSIPSVARRDSFVKLDVTDFSSVQEHLLEEVRGKKNLVLINCAGISYNAFAHKADVEVWRQVVDVNLIGVFNVITCLLPIMRNNGYGRIVNLSSVVPVLGVPGTSAYAASKSALWGLSRAICAENASKGITINNLRLGYFDIGMLNDIPKELLCRIIENIPCKRFGDPKDIYKAIKLLVDCSYINGANIDINGGLI